METGRAVIPAAEEILGRYFPVLDHGFVAMLDYMGGDLAIEQAARCSYHSVGDEVRTIKKTRDLIRFLVRHRHTSPLEMVEVKLHVGMPIFVARQLVRHRTLNWNEFSGRYSEMPLLFYTPEADQICAQSGSNKQGRDQAVEPKQAEQFRGHLLDDRVEVCETYIDALSKGIARETARVDLPLSTYTYAVIKSDLRNLLHLIGLRSDPHAQWEIRQFSDVFGGIAARIAPIAFEAFLDYQFEATAFSRMELDVLRDAGELGIALQDLGKSAALIATNGITGEREQSEFLAKLGRRDRPAFALDLSASKDAAHFAAKIKSARKA